VISLGMAENAGPETNTASTNNFKWQGATLDQYGGPNKGLYGADTFYSLKLSNTSGTAVITRIYLKARGGPYWGAFHVTQPPLDSSGITFAPVIVPTIASHGSPADDTINYDDYFSVPANTTAASPLTMTIRIAHGGGAALPVGLVLANYLL